MRFYLILAVSMALIFLSLSLVSRPAPSFATSTNGCSITTLQTATGLTAESGVCTARLENVPDSDCTLVKGNIFSDEITLADSGKDSGSYDGLAPCNGDTTYNWNDVATVANGGLSDEVSVQASITGGGYFDAQAGEWDSFFVRGTCGPTMSTDLGSCLTISWDGSMTGSAGSPAASIQGDYTIAYLLGYGGFGGNNNFGGQQFCADSGVTSGDCQSTHTTPVSGSSTLSTEDVASGDTITLQQSLYQILSSSPTSAISASGDVTMELTGNIMCPSYPPRVGFGPCIYITLVQSGAGPLPTPVYPIGSLVAVIIPLIALGLYVIQRSGVFRRETFQISRIVKNFALRDGRLS